MEGNMEELKVVNGETYSREIKEIKMPLFMASEQERTASNVRHILAHRKNSRKNLFCYAYGTVTFFGMLLSILCMDVAPLNGTIGFCVFTALFGAFLYSNREVL